MKHLKNSRGFTLIEVVVTMAVATILVVALDNVYITGLKEFQRLASRFKMYEEAALKLYYQSQDRDLTKPGRASLETLIMNAESAYPAGSRLTLTMRAKDPPYLEGDVEIFLNTQNGTLRYNDRRVGKNEFNKQILPIVSESRRRRFRRDTPNTAYRVVSADFRYGDPGGYSIEAEIVMEDDLGNTVRLTTAALINNKFSDE